MKPRKKKDNRRGAPDPARKKMKVLVPEYDFLKDKSLSKTKKDPSIRLNKYIAHAGVCSRREADALIASGKIKVNGKVITELGYKVNPNDKITYKGEVLRKEKYVYILLNKPKDHITTAKDPQNRTTVLDIIHKHIDQRVYPVGRLDRNTTGLLLLTNDGELAERLSHPSYNIKKIYEVQIDKPLDEEDFLNIQQGLELDDGPIKPDELAIVSEDRKTLGIEIHSGRNRIVRRIFESLGYRIMKLDRVMYAFLTKKDLPRGKWRFLQEHELKRMKQLGVGKKPSGE